MSSTITKLHWFPKSPNHFITWGSEINIYEVTSSDKIDNSVVTSKNVFEVFFLIEIIYFFIFIRFKF